MKNKLKNYLDIIFVLIFTFIFYESFIFINHYNEEGSYIYNSEDLIIKNYLKFKITNNDCNFIKKYAENKILFSEVNHISYDEIISLYNKCPESFKEDLHFLNLYKNKFYFINSENEFVFFSVKYFYLLDKEYILKKINEENYDSIGAKLLKEKIINSNNIR